MVGGAALTTASALSATEPQNDLMMANIEALSQSEVPTLPCDPATEQDQCSFNAKLADGTWGRLTIKGLKDKL